MTRGVPHEEGVGYVLSNTLHFKQIIRTKKRGVHLEAGVGNGVVPADDDDAFTPRQNRTQPTRDLVDGLLPKTKGGETKKRNTNQVPICHALSPEIFFHSKRGSLSCDHGLEPSALKEGALGARGV